jgi:hypothetical protein
MNTSPKTYLTGPQVKQRYGCSYQTIWRWMNNPEMGFPEPLKINILDAIREIKPPFSPEAVCEEFATLLKSYRISKVCGDRYAGEWPREQFRKNGINYETSDKSRSELYIELLPLINSRAVDLLDSDRLTTQLVSLERRTARSGRDSVDHPPGGHDDIANAVAGALCRAWTHRSGSQSRATQSLQTMANVGYSALKKGPGLPQNLKPYQPPTRH